MEYTCLSKKTGNLRIRLSNQSYLNIIRNSSIIKNYIKIDRYSIMHFMSNIAPQLINIWKKIMNRGE